MHIGNGGQREEWPVLATGSHERRKKRVRLAVESAYLLLLTSRGAASIIRAIPGKKLSE